MKWLPSDGWACIHKVDILDEGITHFPGEMQWDGVRFQHTTQSGIQFKTFKWFLPGNSYLIFQID